MCGIAGIFSFDRKRNFPPTLIKQMTNTLVHRGPDAEGHWQAEGIALGHRRLSIKRSS
jgi:asparagine synthase (glutamine-hydrolysing)